MLINGEKQTSLHWKSSCKLTKTSVRHFSKNWPHFKTQPEQTKGHFPLAGEKFFSEEFAVAVGRNNVENIYGLEDETIRIAIFAELVEEEALRQLRVGRNSKIEKILNVGADHEFYVRFEYNSDEKIHWKILRYGVCKQNGTSLIQLVGAVLGLSFLDALETLANMVDMQFENLHQLSNKTSAFDEGRNNRISEEIPHLIYTKNSKDGGNVNEFRQSVKVKGSAGQIISGAVLYSRSDTSFILPATVHKGIFCIGRCKAKPFFLNQDKLDSALSAQVLFCQDMRIALALQRILDEIRGYNSTEIIVTAHLGEDLSVLPWNYFFGHSVVFVSAPTKRCMAMVKAYESYLRGARARSFKVHQGFLLDFPADSGLACEVEGVTQAESTLLRLSKVLNDEFQPVAVLRNIIKGATPYSEFIAWGQALGIFKAHQGLPMKVASADDAPVLSEPNPALTPAPAYKLSDVTLYHTMRPGNYVMILGAKGAGKTQLALSLSGALLKGNVQWPLFSGQVMNAGNVAYVDAETPYDEYGVNLEQHGLAPELGLRFLGLNKFAPNLPDFCNIFNLADENFREGLFRYLLQHQCRFVFFDNLAALMGDLVDHGKSASDVLDWVEKLQKSGLCVVFVHHKAGYETASPNKDKARGSQLFAIRARAIIALLSKTEILDNELGTEAVQTKARCDGLTAGLRFAANKTAPVLEHKSLWLHMPLGSAQWEFLALTGVDGEELEFLNDCCKPEIQHADTPVTHPAPHDGAGEVLHWEEPLQGCSPDEIKVYEYIGAHGKAQNADVRKILGCETTKAGEVLNSLMERGLIKREGNGPQTHYRY